MLTKGEIVSVDYNGNTCFIHVPYFDGTVGGEPFIQQATIINQPGIYGGYKAGDIVVVGFEDNELSRLVLLGKLYTGVKNETEARGTINCQSLSVETKSSLPINTSIIANKSDINVDVAGNAVDNKSKNLVEIINRINNLENNITDSANTNKNTKSILSIKNTKGNLSRGKVIGAVYWESYTPSTTPASNFNIRDVWTDGNNVYYADDYVYDSKNNTWNTISINIPSQLHNNCLYYYNNILYHSTSGYNQKLTEDSNQWQNCNWNVASLDNFKGKYIWKDTNNNIYYSFGQTQLKLNKQTDTWEDMIWRGLDNFYSTYIWQANNIIYYSDGTVNKYLDMTNQEWKDKEWHGLTSFYGSGIWKDKDNNYYYSSGFNQYILDINNNTWIDCQSSCSGISNFNNEKVWTDTNNIRYCFVTNDIKKKLSSGTTWETDSSISFPETYTYFKSKYVWQDNNGHIYYSNGTLQKEFINNEWVNKSWPEITNIDRFFGNNIWTDGTILYYNRYYNGFRDSYYFDELDQTWKAQSWTGLTSFNGEDVWYYNNDIYCCTGNSSYYYKYTNQGTWERLSWPSTTYSSDIEGKYIWTDGTDYYCSNTAFSSLRQYKLNSNFTWSTVTWSGITAPNKSYIWSYNGNTYYSNNEIQKVLSGTSWLNMTDWIGISSFSGADIWEDVSNECYYTNKYKFNLINNIKTWETVTWTNYPSAIVTFYSYNIWNDGTNVYYSMGGSSSNYIIDCSTNTWTSISDNWNHVYGEDVWKIDNDHIYMSHEDDYEFEFDKANNTWSNKTWNGFITFEGDYMWTDGTDLYYSEGYIQKKFIEADNKWTNMTWSGLTTFDGNKIWTDGKNIYYCGTHKLNIFTNAWVPVTWKGTYNFLNTTTDVNSCIWSDGDNIYFSNGYYSYVLLNNTWVQITWNSKNSLSYVYGKNIWTDGINIYHSEGSNYYKLKKTTNKSIKPLLK